METVTDDIQKIERRQQINAAGVCFVGTLEAAAQCAMLQADIAGKRGVRDVAGVGSGRTGIGAGAN